MDRGSALAAASLSLPLAAHHLPGGTDLRVRGYSGGGVASCLGWFARRLEWQVDPSCGALGRGPPTSYLPDTEPPGTDRCCRQTDPRAPSGGPGAYDGLFSPTQAGPTLSLCDLRNSIPSHESVSSQAQ